jgi:hypothetical protein
LYLVKLGIAGGEQVELTADMKFGAEQTIAMTGDSLCRFETPSLGISMTASPIALGHIQ